MMHFFEVKMHELLAGAEVVKRCEVQVLDAARGPRGPKSLARI